MSNHMSMKKGGTAKFSPFVLLRDGRSFLFCVNIVPSINMKHDEGGYVDGKQSKSTRITN